MSIPSEGQSPAVQLRILYDEINQLKNEVQTNFSPREITNKIAAVNALSADFFQDHIIPRDVKPCSEKDITEINTSLVTKLRERELQDAAARGGILGWIGSIVIKLKFYFNPTKYAPQIDVKEFVRHVTDLKNKQISSHIVVGTPVSVFATREEAIQNLNGLRDDLKDASIGTYAWVPRGESRDLYIVEDPAKSPVHYPIEYDAQTGAYSVRVRQGEAPYVSFESSEDVLRHVLNEKKKDDARAKLEHARVGSYVKIQLGKNDDGGGYDSVVLMQQGEGKAGIAEESSIDPFTVRINGQVYPGSKEEFLQEALLRLSPGQAIELRQQSNLEVEGDTFDEQLESAKQNLAVGSYYQLQDEAHNKSYLLVKGAEDKVAVFEFSEDEVVEPNLLLRAQDEPHKLQPMQFFTAVEKIKQRNMIVRVEQFAPLKLTAKFNEARYIKLMKKFKEVEPGDVQKEDKAAYQEYVSLKDAESQVNQKLISLFDSLRLKSASQRNPLTDSFVLLTLPAPGAYKIVGAPYFRDGGKRYGISVNFTVLEGGKIGYDDKTVDSVEEMLEDLGASLLIQEAHIHNAIGLKRFAESATTVQSQIAKTLDKNTYQAWGSLIEPGKIYITNKDKFGSVVHYELDFKEFQSKGTAMMRVVGEDSVRKGDLPVTKHEDLVKGLGEYFKGSLSVNVPRISRNMDSLLLTADIADPYSKMEKGANAWKLQKEKVPGTYTLTVYRKHVVPLVGSDQTAKCSVTVLPNGLIHVVGDDKGAVVDRKLEGFEAFTTFLTKTTDGADLSPLKEVALSNDQKLARTALITKLKESASKGAAPAWFDTREKALQVLEESKTYGKYVAKECLLYKVAGRDEVGVIFRNAADGEVVEGLVSIDFSTKPAGVKHVEVANATFRLLNDEEGEPQKIEDVKDLQKLLTDAGLKIASTLPSQVATAKQEVQNLHNEIQKCKGYLFNEFTEVGAKTELGRLNKFYQGEVAPRSWLVIPHREEAGAFAKLGGALAGRVWGVGEYAFTKLSGQEDEYLFAVAPAGADQEVTTYRVAIDPIAKQYKLSDSAGAPVGTFTSLPALLTKIGANSNLSLKELREQEAKVKKEKAAQEPPKPSTTLWALKGAWNIGAAAARGASTLLATGEATGDKAPVAAPQPPANFADTAAATAKRQAAVPKPAVAAEPKATAAKAPPKAKAAPAPAPASVKATSKAASAPADAETRLNARIKITDIVGDQINWANDTKVKAAAKKAYSNGKGKVALKDLIADFDKAGFSIKGPDGKGDFEVTRK